MQKIYHFINYCFRVYYTKINLTNKLPNIVLKNENCFDEESVLIDRNSVKPSSTSENKWNYDIFLTNKRTYLFLSF